MPEPSQSPASPREQPRRFWPDILLAIALAALASVASYEGQQIGQPIIPPDQAGAGAPRSKPQMLKAVKSWFSSDSARVVEDMSDRWGDHYRVKVHPLFVLLTWPPVAVLRKVFRLEDIVAVRATIAVVAALWLATLFALLRLIGCRRFDSVLFSVLGATSAAAVFWFSVPETFSFGSLSILLALVTVALVEYAVLSAGWFLAGSALTLSFTVTNWMVGIFATFANFRWKRALQITVNAFCLVVLLWTVQKLIFPSSQFFLGDREESRYVLESRAGGPRRIIPAFFLHSLVMPRVAYFYKPPESDLLRLSVQTSFPGSGSPWGPLGVALWSLLLALGLWGFFTMKRQPRLRMVIALSLLGQLGLHLVYGKETFLYSLQYFPLLLVLAALSTQTRARSLALGLAGILVVAVGVNNVSKFRQASQLILDKVPPRRLVLSEMRRRPKDPWPGGTGHVLLAVPGTKSSDKAYEEPGGSFSPGVPSFGVALWVKDAQGKLIATSDSLPPGEIHQYLAWSEGQKLPEIHAETPYYQAVWSSHGQGRWILHLAIPPSPDKRLELAVRSVGPAGGPIRTVRWDGQRLALDDRWFLVPDPKPSAVYLGEEGQPGWVTDRPHVTQWTSEFNWGYARLEMPPGDWAVVIEDSHSVMKDELNEVDTRPALRLRLPQAEFGECLNAQVAHLLMGLVGRETRPGDPTDYPASRLREGSYAVVALARAGKLEQAQVLSVFLAEHDFFGSFGPEADEPGLAIWALEEVAKQVRQPDYDQWLWPHVHRKAELILGMLSATEPVYGGANGVIAPAARNDPELHLVAKPARGGLIVGRARRRWPVLYVNAVSYRGLLDAAALAIRVNQQADAARWRAKAAEVQQAWFSALHAPESKDLQTYVASLWPAKIAAAESPAFLQGLQEQWAAKREARMGSRKATWPSDLSLAEAHQWLLLGRPRQVWETLQWFWENQVSPGLYVWGESPTEENAFDGWDSVRGWVKSPYVTPQYATAAQILLLQLDMLGYIEEANPEATLVIGAGISPAWVAKPMSVQGLTLPEGRVDWQWDGKQMRVQIWGHTPMKVRLGPAFPANAPVHLSAVEPGKQEGSQRGSVTQALPGRRAPGKIADEATGRPDYRDGFAVIWPD